MINGEQEEYYAVLYAKVLRIDIYEQFLQLTNGIGLVLGLLPVCFLAFCFYVVWFCCARFIFFQQSRDRLGGNSPK